jgi:outer membrane protein assembly factor BamB
VIEPRTTLGAPSGRRVGEIESFGPQFDVTRLAERESFDQRDVGADGKVFVTVKNAGGGTTLHALDAANGTTIWSFVLGGSFSWSAACYDNGRVFAVNASGLLRAFDGATGAVIWSVQLPNQFLFSAPPSVREGVIYLSGAGSGGTLYAVNASSGALIWTRSVVNGDRSSPAVTSDGVYVSYSCPNVYKFDPATGTQIWFSTTAVREVAAKRRRSTTAVFMCATRQTRSLIARPERSSATSNAKNTPAFSGDKGFFLNGPHSFGTFGVLEARDVNTNNVLWTFSGDGFLQSAVLVVNNYVYVGSSQGNLYAVDAATGQQVWVTTAGTSIPLVDEQNVSQPLTSFAAGEGMLVVPTSTTLVAYDSDITPPTLTFGKLGSTKRRQYHYGVRRSIPDAVMRQLTLRGRMIVSEHLWRNRYCWRSTMIARCCAPSSAIYDGSTAATIACCARDPGRRRWISFVS